MYGPFGSILNGSRLRPSAATSSAEVRRLLPGGPVGAAAPVNLGISNASSGAASYVAPTGGTSLLASVELERWSAAAAAGTTVGHRNGTPIWNRDAFGGFLLRWVFRLGTFVAGANGYRAFVGLRALATAIPAVNPSTLVNIVAVGFDPGAAQQWSLMHNDGAGTAVVTPLGVDFAASASHLMALEIAAERGGSSFELFLQNLTTEAESGPHTIASEIPAQATLLSEHVWLNSSADTTTGPAIDVASIEAETERLVA